MRIGELINTFESCTEETLEEFNKIFDMCTPLDEERGLKTPVKIGNIVGLRDERIRFITVGNERIKYRFVRKKEKYGGKDSKI